MHRNRTLRLNMTEKLFTGTLNKNQNKKVQGCLVLRWPKFRVSVKNNIIEHIVPYVFMLSA